jgi:hypothetical protein
MSGASLKKAGAEVGTAVVSSETGQAAIKGAARSAAQGAANQV